MRANTDWHVDGIRWSLPFLIKEETQTATINRSYFALWVMIGECNLVLFQHIWDFLTGLDSWCKDVICALSILWTDKVGWSSNSFDVYSGDGRHESALPHRIYWRIIIGVFSRPFNKYRECCLNQATTPFFSTPFEIHHLLSLNYSMFCNLR
jgi:hypothetical protein